MTSGDNRYRCVVDGCGWALNAVGSGLPDGRVQVAPESTLLETVARAQSRAVDRELRAHLEGHDVVEFVATISRLRALAEA